MGSSFGINVEVVRNRMFWRNIRSRGVDIFLLLLFGQSSAILEFCIEFELFWLKRRPRGNFNRALLCYLWLFFWNDKVNLVNVISSFQQIFTLRNKPQGIFSISFPGIDFIWEFFHVFISFSERSTKRFIHRCAHNLSSHSTCYQFSGFHSVRLSW